MRTHAPHIARATTARALAALALAGLLASCTSAPRYTRHPETAAPGPQSIVSIGDTTVTVTGRDVVGHAQNYLGTPYRNGGTTTGGMDCSGLVFHVYRSFGIALPRTSSAQSRFGAQVPRSDLQPGDLLFFDVNGRGVSHVGIYSGGGEFIHASNRDRRVRFDRLDNKYFKNRFILARRVL
jgi:cell wall-associated NlpC family hydrolase